jgi:aminoglycoside 3'-phosphotransferase-2
MAESSREDGAMALRATRTPILIGKSGASVVRVQSEDGLEWIEKTGSFSEIHLETEVLEWCSGGLPVAKVLGKNARFLAMSVLPGVNLTETSMQRAAQVIAEALNLVHTIPIEGCPFMASWALRLSRGEFRVRAGLVDESDFDEGNLGRSTTDILAELHSLPPLPDLACFTHGDACLPNFLTQDGKLTGIVDLARAGVTHPAQDWALALRSMRDSFGLDGERLLREHLPDYAADEELLRRFRLLDELF